MPGFTVSGSECGKYLIMEDFFPSIPEMAGISDYKTLSPIDGRSFVPLIKGTGDPSRGRALVWNYPNIWGNDGPGINLNCAVRKGDWKLVYYYETGVKELFPFLSNACLQNLADTSAASERTGLRSRVPETRAPGRMRTSSCRT